MSERTPSKQTAETGFTPRQLVDAETLAKYYRVTSKTIRNWSRDGKIPTVISVGRVIRFDPAEVDRALTQKKQTLSKQTQPDPFPDPTVINRENNKNNG